MKILNVRKKDFLEVLELLKKCHLDFRRNIADLEKAKKVSDVFTVCKNNGKIVGTVRAIFDGYYCLLCDLAVDPLFFRQGIGKLLMEGAEKRLKEKGAKYIFLNSSDEAIKFYKKIGYTRPKINPLIKNIN